MGNNNLKNYETVKQRKLRLMQEHPDSVIMPVFLSNLDMSYNYALIGALIWTDKKVFENLSPEAVNGIHHLAETASPANAGIVMTSIAILSKASASGYSLSMAGGNGADRNAWVENAEESAVGRALDNLGYHSNAPSREEMEKVKHMESAQSEKQAIQVQTNQLMTQLINIGYKPEYLQQLCAQEVRMFNNFDELSNDELIKVRDYFQSLLQQPISS